MYKLILTLHVIGATIWAGGHLVLALGILPDALKRRSLERLQQFEATYERVGLPALIVQILTGLWLAHHYLPDASAWLNLSSPWTRLVALKLLLLALTLGLAADARLRLIPRLDESRLASLAWHIVGVTALSVLLVIAGVGFRTGGLF